MIYLHCGSKRAKQGVPLKQRILANLYADTAMIFLQEPLQKGLYTKICNGNFDSWLKWFKRNNNIEFINKTEIECIAKEMKTALNLYIENG